MSGPNPINKKNRPFPVVAHNQQTKPSRNFVIVPIHELRFRQATIKPEGSEGQGILPVSPLKVVARVVLERQRRERKVVVSLSQPGPTVGSESKVRVSLDITPFCSMHTVMYRCLHLCARFGRSGDGEFDEMEGKGILSHQVEISSGCLPWQY